MIDEENSDIADGIGKYKSLKGDFLPHLLPVLEEEDNMNVNGGILTARLLSLVQEGWESVQHLSWAIGNAMVLFNRVDTM